MINLIRKSSDTPNIQNYDDIRAFKYASCGQNGVVKNYLNSCGYEISGQSFTIKSGEIILDGWQVGIDTSGWTGTINNLSGTVYYTVYLEVDTSITGSETAKIAMTYDTVTYPVIDAGQNLSTTNMGIGRIALYHFQAVDNVISNVQAVFELLDGEVFIAKYASSDYSKGTIEERLTNLGFKQGSFNIINNSYMTPEGIGTVLLVEQANAIVRQGNYCIGNFAFNLSSQRNPDYTGSSSSSATHWRVEITIPEEFRPKEDCKIGVILNPNGVGVDTLGQWAAWLILHPDGTTTFEGGYNTSLVYCMMLNGGWEAAPIT